MNPGHVNPGHVNPARPSPTPWVEGTLTETDIVAVKPNGDGDVVASTNVQADLPWEVRVANAAHIRRAVNNHEALVEALDEALGELRVFWTAQGYREEGPALETHILDVLTKARS